MEYKRVLSLGESVDGTLTVRYPNSAGIISMQGVDGFRAYVVFEGESEPPVGFPKLTYGHGKCKLFDDCELVLAAHGDSVSIYRISGKELLIYCTGEAWVDGMVLEE